MAEPLFLGVDGGATRCGARLRDAQGHLLGEASAGPANARLGDPGHAEVMKACRGALEAAGLTEADFARTWAGFGLAGTQQEEDRLSFLARPHPFAGLAVDTDAYAGWLGAFGGRDGAILIVGTGTAGLAVIGGRRVTVGGWGFDVGDEGSGMMIGRTAIRRSLWAVEGMAPRTPLVDAVMERFDGDPGTAVMWAGEATPGDYGGFTPLVFTHADRRDPLALAILHEAALDVERVVGRLLDLGAPSVAMIGSVFVRILPWLAPPIRSHIVEPAGDAMEGALLMARQAFTESGKATAMTGGGVR